jgi:hypothetical protein
MTKMFGYRPEESERDAARLDSVMDKMIEYLKVFDQKKVSPEDYKKVESYKNGAGVIVRGVNARRDCLVAGGKTAAILEKKRGTA